MVETNVAGVKGTLCKSNWKSSYIKWNKERQWVRMGSLVKEQENFETLENSKHSGA